MRQLGQVVVLVGPNGGGKTRTLDLLRMYLEAFRNYHRDPDKLEKRERLHKLSQAKSGATESGQARPFREVDRAILLRKDLEISSEERVSVADFSIKADGFSHPGSESPAQLKNYFDNAIKRLGTNPFKSQAFWYIHQVASRFWNATHPKTEITEEDRESTIAAWEGLQELVKTLLSGATLTRDVNGDVLINGMLGASAHLSEGQRALLVAATAFHAQYAKLDEAIIIVDEPETHLHPSAQIEFIERLIHATPKGQVWIATHSIHILSHVEPSSLWFADGGTVTYAGGKPESVISRLVGDEERVGRLGSFLRLPAIYAMERFVAECLLPPKIASTGPEDRQSRQIREVIQSMGWPELRVLDYGAGRGRILAALKDGANPAPDRIDYHAFELNVAARGECVKAMMDYYDVSNAEATRRVYGDERALRERLNPGSVHLIVMCNVLHEIPPRDWSNLFIGVIRHCLREDGYLLIVEDMQIPHGEHAHAHGFILLDTEQLQELFGIKDREDSRQFRSYGDGRLKAHLISAEAVAGVSQSTVTTALERRCDSAIAEIEHLRREEPSFANGRLLGLYAMLHANGTLALRERA